MNSRTGPRVWLFQANPEQFDLETELATVSPGDRDWWTVTRYHHEMKAGDLALLWQSGPKAGIYGIAEPLGEPYERPPAAQSEPSDSKPYMQAKRRVDLRYTHILGAPIRKSQLTGHPVLRDTQVLANARGTNFRVRPEEWAALIPMIGHGTLGAKETDDMQGSGSSFDIGSALQRALAAAGFSYTEWQVATFYTALQTKGFVILSGISGTGKSKLAQHFATSLEANLPPADADDLGAVDAIHIEHTDGQDGTHERIAASDAFEVRDYMLKRGDRTLPPHVIRALPRLNAGESIAVPVTLDGIDGTGKLWQHTVRGQPQQYRLILQGTLRQLWRERYRIGDHCRLLVLRQQDSQLPRIVLTARLDETDGAGAPSADPVMVPGPSTPRPNENARQDPERGWLFLSVRPDWRDSKSLLGYYNPLTERYEWTPFLRFLLRAAHSYRAEDGRAWFVILDEMNLAHVEYYFADLLSVLESGRDADGWTREPLRLTFPADAQGELPPPEIALPPNLYVVGTVNVDETTHAFSPKVLDRAFSLELSSVDFGGYPPAPAAAPSLSPEESAALLKAFTDDGRFPRIDKAVVARYVANRPEVRLWLQALNEQLAPHNLHLGYRVFDEVVCFLDHAERNGMFARPPRHEFGQFPAFDAAVLMKVLPKFHGSRGKLEAPLRAILSWCLDPEDPDPTALDAAARQRGLATLPTAELDPLPYRFPSTAKRVIRMLHDLYQDGFAAFG